MNKKIYFGTYAINTQKEMDEAIKCAIENNYDCIDAAYIYHNEDILGNTLNKLQKDGYKIPPIQTKYWPERFSFGAKHELLNSLKKLQINKIDSYMIHRPHFSMEENIKAWKELIKLKKNGLVNRIGVSNFEKDMIKILIKETNVKPEFNQIELSVQNIRGDRIKFNHEENIEIQGWSPLGNIALLQKNATILKIAQKHNATPSQILIAFVWSLNAIPIVKSTHVNRIIENKQALNINLDSQDIKELKKLNTYSCKFGETFAY